MHFARTIPSRIIGDVGLADEKQVVSVVRLVCQFHQFGADEGSHFIVMEWINGMPLGRLIRKARKSGGVGLPIALRVGIDVARALHYAHIANDEHGEAFNIIHRDVSPHNILVGTDGIARLTDFGVAKADVRMASTRAGQFKGKLSYMAPEQASSNQTDQRSDLFSVGIILWESLTGRRLFKGDSNAATLNRLLHDEVVPPSRLWADLTQYDGVVMKALSRDPSQRFQSADEFAEALDACASRSGVAKTRDVAEVVRALDAEKLQQERQRVRDAIDTLGRTQFPGSKVPMPREGIAHASQTYSRADTLSPEGSVSGMLTDGTPVIVRQASDSNLLKWFVMLLAALVFMYAAFLVSQLLGTPPAPRAEEPFPSVAPQTEPQDAKPPAAAKQPSRPPEEGPTEIEPLPEAKPLPVRRPRRKRIRPTPQPAAKAATPSEPKSSGQAAPTAPAEAPSPKAEPVDIDIQNPYRN